MTAARAGSTIDGALLPPVRRMPGLIRALDGAAAEVAVHARPVLRANDAVLLAMTATTADPAAALSASFWNARCMTAAMRLPIGDDARGSSFALLEIAARRVLAELIARWPANALPPALGIFTDGSGVAFSSDHPSPLAAGWLARHQAGRCPTTVLHPFGANAAWTLLIARRTGGRLQ